MFSLRTVPPITRCEATFLQQILPTVSSTFFVQNRWTDESDNEVAQGREQNEEILRRIKEERHLGNLNPKVRVVNAYEAHLSALKSDENGFRSSGAGELTEYLFDVSRDWKEKLIISVGRRITAELAHALGVLWEKREDFASSRESLEKEIEKERKRFEAYIRDIERRKEQAEVKLSKFIQKQWEFSSKWKEETQRKLRNEGRNLLRGGVTDGPHLRQALRDIEEYPHDEAWNHLNEEIMKMSDRLREDFEEVEPWETKRTDNRRSVNLDKSTQWQSIIPKIGGAGGSIGGYFAVTWAAAKTGAAIGSSGGPWGTVAGVAAGVIVGLVGGWLGSKAGKRGAQAVVDSRGDKAWPFVKRAIDDFTRETSKAITDESESFSEKTTAALTQWLADQKEKHEKEMEKRLSVHDDSRKEKSRRIEQMKSDEIRLNGWLIEITG
jgi:prefoldin subunit 5